VDVPYLVKKIAFLEKCWISSPRKFYKKWGEDMYLNSFKFSFNFLKNEFLEEQKAINGELSRTLGTKMACSKIL
jgi:hypothetical protein